MNHCIRLLRWGVPAQDTAQERADGGALAGVAKDWLLIVLSVLLFHSKVSATSLAGYVVAFAGVKYYDAQRVKALQSAAEAKEGACGEAEDAPLLEEAASACTTSTTPAATPRVSA